MTLHISEAEVRAVLTMPMAIEAVEEISRKQATGEVVVHPRRRFELPGGGFFHYMAAADFSAGYVAMKQYTFVRGELKFLVPLYDMKSGDLRALIEADYMGQLRTGAASGVATKYLARQNSRIARELERRGLIRGYRTELDAESLGLRVHAFVHVTINAARHAEFEAAATGHPAVLQCFTTAGQADYLMHVLVGEVADLDQLLRMEIRRMPGVQKLETTVCMKTIKPRAPLTGCLR